MALLCADTVVAESGIALTMESVTFFRNVAEAMFGGALVVLNPWPLRGFVKDTSFIQGDALVFAADIYDWHPQGGPGAREGKANHVQLNTVYDGGYTTAGLMPYAHSRWFAASPATNQDEPNAIWNYTDIGGTSLDNGALDCAGAAAITR